MLTAYSSGYDLLLSDHFSQLRAGRVGLKNARAAAEVTTST